MQDRLREIMSAKSAGRSLLTSIALVFLILLAVTMPPASGLVMAVDDESPRPPPAPLIASHSHQQERVGSPLIAAPSKPKPLDVYAYLPLLAWPMLTWPVCDLNAEEQAIADLAIGDPEQEREEMHCHYILAQVARDHAIDMATRDFLDHVNPDDIGPNYRLEQAGYELPDWYDQKRKDNNVESIAGHFSLDTPEKAWNFWVNSASEIHVLGDSDFFAEQTNYGIGYAFSAGSEYKHYWVFISAPPLGS
jgi:hypothetical protein